MELMELYKTDTGWICRCDSNKDIFGTTDIPTPFTAQANSKQVLDAIKKLNPSCNVILL